MMSRTNSTSTNDNKNKDQPFIKGHWLFSFYQKNSKPDLEANIKISMRPDNGFNLKNINSYINNEPSKEEVIKLKKERGEPLKSTEQVILDNYLKKKAEAIRNDFKMIEIQKFNANPQTREGRLKLLLDILVSKIQKSEHIHVANIYLRLIEDDFNTVLNNYPELKMEYNIYLKQMNEIIKKLNIIELQFTRFYAQMPPLNHSGFKKFDQWQIEVIKNINENVSTIINAPTSAGKSVLSAYTTTKGKVLFAVPTDALAWQMAAYIGHILNVNIPIVTATYQTHLNRNEMIECLNRSQAIVGTPEQLVDFLPFIHNKFSWIVFDEIHMIGKIEGSAMEYIAKLFPDVPILALSATIGNTDELVNWFNKLSHKKVDKVVCDKRFFNLQRFYYETETNSLVSINPLALVEESQISDGSILCKSLQPTPPTTWDLAMKMLNKIDLAELNPYKYFSTEKRIELDEANIYFYKLVKILVDTYQKDKQIVMDIINSYKHESLTTGNIDLIKLAFHLKNEHKTPAIIFQKNTLACLRMAREFAKNIEDLEEKTYPKLKNERNKIAKMAKRLDKKNKEDTTKKSENNKKEMKEFIGVKIGKKKRDGESYTCKSINPQEKTTIIPISEQEPHHDFIFNKDQYFTEDIVEGWLSNLSKYFPNTGIYYHFIIKLLWRGVGIYAKGLPDPYLRLVQTLACQKQLAIVFSDESLVFGVSMPFRTVVVVYDNKLKDDLEPMMFHQMSGRAGRRGLDKEGNIIFAGYSWNRIKELSISEPPIITGTINNIYTIPHANQLSKIFDTKQNWNNIFKNFLDSSVSNDDANELLEDISSNYNGGWKFGIISNDVNHLHMNWKLRYTEECLIASYLLPYLRRAFENKDPTLENNQILLAHFLCRFISIVSTDTPDNILIEPIILSEQPYNRILDELEKLQLQLPKMIDNQIFLSIQQNSLIKTKSENSTDELRQRLIDFGEKIKNIQHYCFHSNIIGLSRIMGKLLTRIWWIYHNSSPIMKPLYTYEDDISSDE